MVHRVVIAAWSLFKLISLPHFIKERIVVVLTMITYNLTSVKNYRFIFLVKITVQMMPQKFDVLRCNPYTDQINISFYLESESIDSRTLIPRLTMQ